VAAPSMNCGPASSSMRCSATAWGEKRTRLRQPPASTSSAQATANAGAPPPRRACDALAMGPTAARHYYRFAAPFRLPARRLALAARAGFLPALRDALAAGFFAAALAGLLARRAAALAPDFPAGRRGLAAAFFAPAFAARGFAATAFADVFAALGAALADAFT